MSGGTVSGALVHRAVVGDVIRLGPPMGDMVLDTAVYSDLLLMACGTGLAPIRALVEEVARRVEHHQVDLFLGARDRDELYTPHLEPTPRPAGHDTTRPKDPD